VGDKTNWAPLGWAGVLFVFCQGRGLTLPLWRSVRLSRAARERGVVRLMWTGPATETLFASALVVSRAWVARSTDCGLSAGILTAGPDQQVYSPHSGSR